MIEKFVEGSSLPDAYHKALKELYWNGALTECPDWNCKQKELSMTFVVKSPLEEPMISKFFIGGPDELEQYRQEMLDGILDFEVGKNWHYTYHDRMVNYPMYDAVVVYDDGSENTKRKVTSNQIEFVKEELMRNPYSRRAVIDIRNNNRDLRSNDPACLQHIQYFIRDGKLDCCVIFRSNDACKATFMNAYALICLQQRIAIDLGVSVGTYTHRANSFHCYEKDFMLLNSYISSMYVNSDKVAYRFKDEWDELMDDAKEGIREKVERLKNNG